MNICRLPPMRSLSSFIPTIDDAPRAVCVCARETKKEISNCGNTLRIFDTCGIVSRSNNLWIVQIQMNENDELIFGRLSVSSSAR